MTQFEILNIFSDYTNFVIADNNIYALKEIPFQDKGEMENAL